MPEFNYEGANTIFMPSLQVAVLQYVCAALQLPQFNRFCFLPWNVSQDGGLFNKLKKKLKIHAALVRLSYVPHAESTIFAHKWPYYL